MGIHINNIKRSVFLLLFLLFTGVVIYLISLKKTKILFYNLKEYTLNYDIKSLEVLLDDKVKKIVLDRRSIELISKKLAERKVKKISIDGFNIGEKIIFSTVYFSDDFMDFSIAYKNQTWVVSQISFSH